MKEALKLALEALESSQRFVEASANAKLRPGWGEQLDIADAAITAIEVDLKGRVSQREWVGLTEAQFLEATRLAENGNYLVAFVRIQEWLKEQNT